MRRWWRFLARPRLRSQRPRGALGYLLPVETGAARGHDGPKRPRVGPTLRVSGPVWCRPRRSGACALVAVDNNFYRLSSIALLQARASVITQRTAHSLLTHRAGRIVRETALRGRCAAVYESSQELLEYLQPANADAAAPPRQAHRSPRRGPARCARNAAARRSRRSSAPVGTRSPHR